jgi:hypothetical protein
MGWAGPRSMEDTPGAAWCVRHEPATLCLGFIQQQSLGHLLCAHSRHQTLPAHALVWQRMKTSFQPLSVSQLRQDTDSQRTLHLPGLVWPWTMGFQPNASGTLWPTSSETPWAACCTQPGHLVVTTGNSGS